MLALKGKSSVTEVLLAVRASPTADNKDKRTQLHFAARQGHVKVTEVLLAAGSNPNSEDKDKRTPLHSAAFGGHVPVSEALLAAGASQNAGTFHVWRQKKIIFLFHGLKVVPSQESARAPEKESEEEAKRQVNSPFSVSWVSDLLMLFRAT